MLQTVAIFLLDDWLPAGRFIKRLSLRASRQVTKRPAAR
jgi:hypothetical protein